MKRKKRKSTSATSNIVVEISGGVVQNVIAPKGVKVTIRDYDNCEVCGGVACQGGHISPCPGRERRNAAAAA
jgi:hypothetical protein